MVAALTSAPTRDTAANNLTFGMVRTREELTQAFRLVYQSYNDAGLVDQKRSGMRVTPYHLLPTSEVMMAKHADDVVLTVSLFGDGYLGLPMQSMYPSEIAQLRDEQGLRLAEIGCLASRRSAPGRFMDAFAELGKLVAQVARARKIDALVAAMHPKHARLYTRVMGFRQIGTLTDCPYANGNPAVALMLNFKELHGTPLYQHYFGKPWSMRELRPYRWDRGTRLYFRSLLAGESLNRAGDGIKGYYNWAVATGNLTA